MTEDARLARLVGSLDFAEDARACPPEVQALLGEPWRRRAENELRTSEVFEQLHAELSRFPNLRSVRWVQDEPANMGPWPHMALNLTPELDGIPFYRVSRPESSSPSVGQHSRHIEEQKALIQQAFS